MNAFKDGIWTKVREEIDVLCNQIKESRKPHKEKPKTSYASKYSQEELDEMFEFPEVEEEFFDPEKEYGIPIRGEF